MMEQKNIRRYFFMLMALLGIFFISGCNRGYGCPGELGFFEFFSNLF